VIVTLLAASVIPGSAVAGDTDFGPNDLPTVFYISKSDDKNRVDYGIRLDGRCAPTKDDAVWPYWREFENAPPVRIHPLGTFEYVPYGISEQRSIRKTLNGGIHMMKLRQFDKTQIGIVTKKEADGHCSSQARAIINGKESELTYIYVKLGKGGLTPSVEYVDVHGKDLDTGAEITERKKP
jgi:hypothetical protein